MSMTGPPPEVFLSVNHPEGGSPAPYRRSLGIINLPKLSLLVHVPEIHIFISEAGRHCQHKDYSGIIYSLLHLKGLRNVHGKGLLAQHMLARLGSRNAHRRMAVVPCADIHSLDVSLLQHLFHGGIHMLDIVFFCCLFCPLEINVADSCGHGIAAILICRQMGGIGNITGSYNTNFDFFALLHNALSLSQ